jgi:ABC-type sugar transport system ATPase subunit
VAGVRIEGLFKAFGRHVAVDIPELTVADGSFFSLLGPSGCGKTTTLRLIAGLADADAGAILIGRRDATSVPPSDAVSAGILVFSLTSASFVCRCWSADHPAAAFCRW